jgi:signal transduction histidine kinase
MNLFQNIFKKEPLTSAEQLNEENSNLRERLTAVSEINEAIVGIVDYKKVLDLITNKLVSVIGVSYATIFVWDESESSLSVGSITIPKTVSVIAENTLGNPINSFKLSAYDPNHQTNDYIRAIVENQTLETDNLYSLSKPFINESAAKIIQGLLKMKIAISIPLVVQDTKLGVLGIIWHESQFTEQDKLMIDTFANQISTTIYNAQLFQKVENQITLLENKNSELQSLYTLTNEITQTLDPDKVAQVAMNAMPQDETMLGAFITFYDATTGEIRLKAFTETKFSKSVENIIGDFNEYVTQANDPQFAKSPIVMAVKTGQAQYADNIEDLLSPPVPKAFIAPVQKLVNISTAIIHPIRARGEVVGAVTFLIHDKKYAELEEGKKQLLATYALQVSIALENANSVNRLETALTQLKEARRQERDMIDVMGHELRTPLSIVRNAILILDRTFEKNNGVIDKDFLRRYLNMSIESVRREIVLLETLLSATKLGGSRMQLFLTKVESDDVIKDSLESQKAIIQQKLLKVNYTPSNPDTLFYADRVRTQEIMDNFLSNAAKYTEKGEITISAWQDNEFGWIRIVDTGMGIAPEDLQNLGKKFFRAKQYIPSSTSDTGEFLRPGGTGLGLYVAFNLLRMQGGKLFINSTVGEGSTFTFGLPVYQNQPNKNVDESLSVDANLNNQEHVTLNGTPPQPPQ